VDDLTDIPPPSIARKLRVSDVAKRRARRRAPAVDTTVGNSTRFYEISYSDHLFNDVLSAAIHAIAAKKFLGDPQLLDLARDNLERWISSNTPAPRQLLEWRHILAGTPQQIAAVALSLNEEGTRLRSSSPLACLVTSERAAVYALFGKSVRGAPHAEVLSIASAMRAQGLADHFVARAVDLSQEFEGILDLMRMWRDDLDTAER
jgi:hypothetical protein